MGSQHGRTGGPVIQATDRIHAVLKRDERLLEVLATASPAFEKLRNPALRRTMARLVTVEQAAKIAGLEATALLDRLNRALQSPEGGSVPEAPAPVKSTEPVRAPVPEKLIRIPADAVVECDVRDDLRAGKEPFQRILAAARTTPDGGVLKVWAIFEPAPLYAVLGRQGFTPFTERIAADDWCVWFHRDGGPSEAAKTESTLDVDADLILLDVRGLEPPEPMVRTLEALAAMPRGKTLVQLNVRVPQFLIPKLEERGFTYEVHEQSEDLVRLFIRHKQQP